ncbi:hypothetical protein PG996_000135 [Apiospora saccharicola]|uniref:Transcription factor Iwr1 domain-containing protein n=1 Tax=Apiospora saccharicola TaxID=335842 RepID=A0ABR1WCX0_9PEZI
MVSYSASKVRQAKREQRRLLANANREFEECPMKAQAKAYIVARDLERQLDVDPEGSFFGACDDDNDFTSQSPPATTTETNFPKRRKGILRRRGSQTEESRKTSSSPSLSAEAIPKSLLEPSAETPTTNPKAVAKVTFAPGDATNLETGEDVPANQSGLSKRDWEIMIRSNIARAELDFMKAQFEGRPIEKDSDDDSDSDSDYICSSDEDDSIESEFEEEDEDEEEKEERAGIELGVKGDGDDAEEDYDERLSSNGTKEDSDDWNPYESDSDSDSESDSSDYDDEYESEDEEAGPAWEFC